MWKYLSFFEKKIFRFIVYDPKKKRRTWELFKNISKNHTFIHTHTKIKKQQKIWLKKEANEKDVKREHAWYYIISKKNEEIKNYNGLRIHI